MNLIFEKARDALMEAFTVSNLELMAAFLAARLRPEIQQALTVPLEQTFM